MKIRTDFVTNSSSNAFAVLQLTDKKGNYLVDQYCEAGGSLPEQTVFEQLFTLQSIEELCRWLEENGKWFVDEGHEWFEESWAQDMETLRGLDDIHNVKELYMEYGEDNGGEFTPDGEDEHRIAGYARVNFVKKTIELETDLW